MTLEKNITDARFVREFTSVAKLDNVLVGRYLSLEDNIFVENVVADIQHFLSRGEDSKKSVLIFPPVNNYRRFLIHKVCEEDKTKVLGTFSIGQGFSRRTVVCFKNLIRKPSVVNKSNDQSSQNIGDQSPDTMVVERQSLSEGSSPEHNCQNGGVKRVRAPPAIYRPPAARKLEALASQNKQNPSAPSTVPVKTVAPVTTKAERTRSGTRQRRPDLQVYVPRAKRATMMDQNTPEPQVSHEVSSANNTAFGTKKNSNELQPKFHNTSVNSTVNNVVTSTPQTRSAVDGRQLSKEMEVEDPEIKHNSGKSIIKDCSLNESLSIPILKISVPFINGDYSNNVSVANVNEIKDLCETFDSKSESCEPTNTELGELLMSSVPSSENGCVNSEFHRDKNDSRERIVLEDSKCDIDVVSVGSFKESDIQEVGLKSSTKDANSEADNCGVKDECLQSAQDISAVLKEVKTTNKELRSENSISESQESAGNSWVLRGNFTSDVLIISDHDSPPKSLDTTAVEEVSVETDAAETTKRKSPKVSSVNEEEKNSTVTPAVSLNPDECTWDMLFDDNGDCLDPKIMEELTSAVGSVSIEKPQSNYHRFISKPDIHLPGGDGEFSHVLEIYDFPSEFKTQDLLSIFAPYKNGGFEIKWVDDTHALGVFSSSRVAADVLANEHPFVKTRPLSEATPESRIKARRSAEFLQPYKSRPETCVALARRLVTGALGMRVATSREEREAERRLLKEAREKKRLAAKQQQDAWDGTIR